MTSARARRSDGPRSDGDRAPERHHGGGARRAVGPVAPSLQLKPAVVGAPGDAFEQEADHAAESIAKGGSAPALSPVGPQALQRLAQAPAVSADDVEEGGGVAQALFDEEETEEEPAQAKSASSAGPRSVDVPRPGPGAPLAPATRSTLESGLGTDLGDVRVHDDQAARSTADAMGAKAFTQGKDISLGSGQSAADVGLMAHEAAHVVQQAGGSGSVAQKADATSSPTSGGPAPTLTKSPDSGLPSGGAVDTVEKLVTLPTIKVPKSKYDSTKDKVKNIDLDKERSDKHRDEWQKAADSGDLQTAANAVLADSDVAKTVDQAGKYYLTNSLKPGPPIIVTSERLKQLGVRPMWDKQGVPTSFQIDHKLEHQLGGGDEAENLWLLEEQANMSSGGQIQNQLSAGIKKVFKEAKDAGVANVPADKSAAKAAKWKFTVEEVSKEPITLKGEREDSRWALKEVTDGEPLKQLRAMTPDEMAAAGGSPATLVLYLGAEGGTRADVDWGEKGKSGEIDAPKGWWFHLESRKAGRSHNNFNVEKIRYDNVAGKGAISGQLFKKDKEKKGIGPQPVPLSILLAKQERLGYAGFVQKQDFLNQVRTLIKFPKLSPIELEEMDLAPDKALVARGRLLPTVPLIAKAEIDVVIDGDDFYLSKVFTADDFSFPGPIKVGECSLELQFGTKGLAILGQANFEIEGLGKGRVGAMAKADLDEVGFALEGEFDFLSDLFDPAHVEILYQDGELSGKGVLGVKEGKVKGLKSASVTAEFDSQGIRANGTFATTIPGVESGTLAFAYKEDGTVELGGKLSLGSKIPGISSGTVEAQLVRNPEGGWKVFGKIQAFPSIPGIGSQITGTYDDGAIQVETTVAYARGMAAGSLTVGFTNRPLDAATGKPAGEPGSDLVVYGGGQVALTLAPWLKATAGLRLLPNGEIEVVGQIGLPEALELFPRKSLDKQLFKVGIDIPIIGISVAGQNIGIFATIAGGAQLLAHFGPAELKELNLGVTWNPDHEEDTTVTGHASLVVPAGAGIKLTISAALGAGIPVVSARLGLEVGGYLGIAASVGAAVDINWTPAKGLVLDAVAKASAEPVFIFTVMGFVSVDLDLWLKTINLYRKNWMLGAVQYGSGLRLGVSLPIHYEEGKQFEPSLSDVTFEVPDINPRELLSGLIDQVT